MINTVEIKNFRGFQNFGAKGFGQVNVIVGDNAVGKTAFLEAIWLTLVKAPDKVFSLKQWRGFDLKFSANYNTLAEELYGDLYHDPESDDPATIELTGQGAENRLLSIEKTRGTIRVPLEQTDDVANSLEAKDPELARLPIDFVFRNEKGIEHRTYMTMLKDGLQIQGTGELDLPDCHLFSAQVPVPTAQAAHFLSALVRQKKEKEFKKIFLSVFDWILDIQVDSQSGTVLADVPWSDQLLPLPILSGGTSRVATILLTVARHQTSIVLVDEIESGVFHSRQKHLARALTRLADHYKTQLFMTVHSEEWLENFLGAIDAECEPNVIFWRMERYGNGPPQMRRFSVEEFRSGIAMGEMR